jgi:hypothetical protein
LLCEHRDLHASFSPAGILRRAAGDRVSHGGHRAKEDFLKIIAGTSWLLSLQKTRTTDEDDHYPFELEKITLWFYFAQLDPRISSTEMKAARKRTNKLSRLLQAALDTALMIVLGYGLILLSHSQAPF